MWHEDDLQESERFFVEEALQTVTKKARAIRAPLPVKEQTNMQEDQTNPDFASGVMEVAGKFFSGAIELKGDPYGTDYTGVLNVGSPIVHFAAGAAIIRLPSGLSADVSVSRAFLESGIIEFRGVTPFK